MIKNILITGGAGYIGSHILEILSGENNNLYIVDNLSTGYRRLINKKAKFFNCNISNKNKIKAIIKEYNIDTIIHLAASLVVEQGEKNPKQFYRNNVEGTKKLIESCVNTKVKNFIFSSTAAVYKDGLKKVSEKSELKPKSVYGKTKLKAERLIISFCKKRKLNYGILRYFNIVGSSNSGKIGLINKSDHLFKNFSCQILKKKPVLRIYGTNYKTIDGSCVRDFIHVTDIAEIHIKVLKLIDKTKKSHIFNCGYGKGVSVKQVVSAFKKLTKNRLKIVEMPRRKGDISEIISNNKKIMSIIKWKPKFNNLDLMVKSSVKWEKKLNY